MSRLLPLYSVKIIKRPPVPYTKDGQLIKLGATDKAAFIEGRTF